VPIHVGDLQLSFVDCGFKGHATPEGLLRGRKRGILTDGRAGPLLAHAFPVTFDDVRRVMIPNAFVCCGESLAEGRCCRKKRGELALTYAVADMA
jgi:hypothetical protein